MLKIKPKEEVENGDKSRKLRSGSVKSWPSKSAWIEPITKRNKTRFVFDHLWGIPGGMHKQDLLLLRNLHRSEDARKNKEEYNPYLILDERDIAENTDLCCNHSFGRTAREYTWHSGLHGLKYLSYSREHIFERVLWGIICITAIVLSIYFSVKATVFYYESQKVFTVLEEEKTTDDDDFPSITFCMSTFSSSVRRSEVSRRLPMMRYLWPTWDDIFSLAYDPVNPNSILWENVTSSSVKRLLQRIMVEGMSMAAPSCSETTLRCFKSDEEFDCCGAYSQTTLTSEGPCFTINLDLLGKSQNVMEPLGNYMANARKDLKMNIRLSGTSSKRVGYPIVNLTLWGESYLCGNSWGEKEAEVICKSLGFQGGQRYFMNTGPAFPATNVMGKISCRGDEMELKDCPFSYENYDGHALTKCDRAYPVALLCDAGGLQYGSKSKTRTKGKPFLRDKDLSKSYFCKDHFSDSEAVVFCNMLSWKYGKVVKNEKETRGTVTRFTNTKCTGKEAHILDCSHTYNANPTSCESVFIECSPGFPLTLRLYNPVFMTTARNLTFGYPVIDTTGREGYICDSPQLINVSTVICKSLGYEYGIKLPPNVFGKPTNPVHFVLNEISCKGNENSIFQCELGVWGDHGNGEDCLNILSVFCSSEKTDFKVRFLDSVDYKPLKVIDTPNALIAVQIFSGESYVPICDDNGLTWSDKEADLICRSENFDCGMVNRRASQALTIPVSNRRYPQLLPFFATIHCDTKDETEYTVNVLRSCSITFSKGCDSGRGTSAICLKESNDEYEMCRILKEKDTSHSSIAEFSTRELPEMRIELRLGPTLDSEEYTCGEKQGRKNHEFYVDNSKEPVYISGNQVIKTRIFSRRISTDSEVIDQLSFEERGCKPAYDEKSCETSCESQVSILLCQCIPWWHSMRPENDREDVCSNSQLICLRKIKKAMDIAHRNFSVAISIIEKIGLWRPEFRKPLTKVCACPITCDTRKYYSVVSRNSEVKTCKSQSGANAELILFFDKSRSMRYERRIIFAWEYLLGIVGGIMALFIGFSFVTIVEIIYFSTVRLYRNIKPLPPKYDSTLADWASKWRNERRNKLDNKLKKFHSNPDLTKTTDAFWQELESVQALKIKSNDNNDNKNVAPESPPMKKQPVVKKTQKPGTASRSTKPMSSRPASKKPLTARSTKGTRK